MTLFASARIPAARTDDSGFTRVDMILASFGLALTATAIVVAMSVFARHDAAVDRAAATAVKQQHVIPVENLGFRKAASASLRLGHGAGVEVRVLIGQENTPGVCIVRATSTDGFNASPKVSITGCHPTS